MVDVWAERRRRYEETRRRHSEQWFRDHPHLTKEGLAELEETLARDTGEEKDKKDVD